MMTFSYLRITVGLPVLADRNCVVAVQATKNQATWGRRKEKRGLECP